MIALHEYSNIVVIKWEIKPKKFAVKIIINARRQSQKYVQTQSPTTYVLRSPTLLCTTPHNAMPTRVPVQK